MRLPKSRHALTPAAAALCWLALASQASYAAQSYLLSPVGVRPSPELPTTADALKLQISADISAGCGIFAAPPRIDGHAIRVTVEPTLDLECPFPATHWTAELVVGKVPAATYHVTIESGTLVVGEAELIVRPSLTSVNVLDERFRVHATWRAALNQPEQSAQVVRISGQAAYFWFGEAGNAELTVKVLDGRAINGHYWVFVSSLTTLPFSLYVDDTQRVCNGQFPCPLQKIYGSPGGPAWNQLDVAAFPP